MHSKTLESHLRDACKSHPQLKRLKSQWNIDKELISNALQNITQIFPHFSRHDASHSKQILVNIERILGEKIKFLSATDTWLILESAYNHDIGMVITEKQIQDLNTPEFQSFLDHLIFQKENPLSEFAQKWKNGSIQLSIGSKAHEINREYIQLIAEWFRRKHAGSSSKIVRDPMNEIGLNSPRNELLPSRLFGILSDICRSHGENFDYVLKLPFAEVGIATEDCHPRFVACLLRIADLLDIDDNRFCPVMLRTCGSSLPDLSALHVEKHQSIRRFRLDSERIQIELECPTPESYEITHDWFKWLEDEYHNQTQFWNKIVPSNDFGTLPTLSTPTVKIAPPYVVISPGEKPQFKIDTDAILELVRGTGLYSSKHECIREILQNAVDASLIALWIEHENEIKDLEPTTPQMTSLFDKYRINIDIRDCISDSSTLLLKVTDKGIGIDFQTIKYIFSVGSSAKNWEKQKIINEMPTWYKPSGAFGLGIQSIFLLSDEFIIKSKSRITNECHVIEFYKSEKNKILIKNIEASNEPYGTSIEIRVKAEKFPNQMQNTQKYTAMHQEINRYDFTNEDSDLSIYEKTMIINSINEFNFYSPIKIEGLNEAGQKGKRYFCKKSNTILSNVKFIEGHGSITSYFRGQKFEKFNRYVDFVNLEIDFYGYPSKEFLTYNRENILPNMRCKAYIDTLTALQNYIEAEFESIDEKQKPTAAIFYYFYFSNTLKDNPDYISTYMWKYEVLLHNGKKTLKELIDNFDKYKHINTYELSQLDQDEPPIEASSNTLNFTNRNSHAIFKAIVKLAKENNFWLILEKKDIHHKNYRISRENEKPLSDTEFKDFLLSIPDDYWGIGQRHLFPCWDRFECLAINANPAWGRKYFSLYSDSKYMVLPIYCKEHVELDESDDLCEWTFKNRANQNVSLKEISDSYSELRKTIKKMLEQNS